MGLFATDVASTNSNCLPFKKKKLAKHMPRMLCSFQAFKMIFILNDDKSVDISWINPAKNNGRIGWELINYKDSKAQLGSPTCRCQHLRPEHTGIQQGCLFQGDRRSDLSEFLYGSYNSVIICQQIFCCRIPCLISNDAKWYIGDWG